MCIRDSINSLPDGVVIEIKNSQGNICRIDEVGEIYIKHPCTASFYWNNWQKTRESFHGEWFKTKDLAFINQDGYIVYVSRVDELVKINGLAVSIIEVEDVIMRYPGVEDCLVSVKQNRNNIDKLNAMIVFNGDESSLRKYLQLHLEAYKIPTFIEQVKEIPKTWSGKKFRRRQWM